MTHNQKLCNESWHKLSRVQLEIDKLYKLLPSKHHKLIEKISREVDTIVLDLLGELGDLSFLDSADDEDEC